MGRGPRRWIGLAFVAIAALLTVVARATEPTAPKPAAEAAPKKPDVVTLAVAWPRDLSADVSYDRKKTQTGKATQELHLNGKVTAVARGEDLVVRHGSWSGAPPEAAPMIRAADKVAVVIGPDGAVRKVEGVAEAVELMRKVPPFDQDVPAIQQALKLAGPAMEKEATEQWGLLVSLWAGGELEVGEDYVNEATVPVTLIPGASVRLEMRFKVARRLECPPPRAGACVELRYSSRPDPDGLKKLAVALVEQLGAPRDQLEKFLGELRTELDATLVTEPATLVPHRLDLTKTVRVSGTAGEAGERVDVQRWVYRHRTAR